MLLGQVIAVRPGKKGRGGGKQEKEGFSKRSHAGTFHTAECKGCPKNRGRKLFLKAQDINPNYCGLMSQEEQGRRGISGCLEPPLKFNSGPLHMRVTRGPEWPFALTHTRVSTLTLTLTACSLVLNISHISHLHSHPSSKHLLAQKTKMEQERILQPRNLSNHFF